MGFVSRPKLAALAVAAVTLVAAQAAQAASLAFTTTGSFNGGGSSLQVGGATGPTLTFTGVNVSSNSFTPGAVNFSGSAFFPGFGTFALDNNFSATPFTGSTFVLTITQTLPAASNNPQPIAATLTGTVQDANGGVIVQFNPASVATLNTAFGSYIYNPADDTLVKSGTSSVLAATITLPPGAPTFVPLPPAIAGGVTLCGAILGVRRIRKAPTA